MAMVDQVVPREDLAAREVAAIRAVMAVMTVVLLVVAIGAAADAGGRRRDRWR